MIHFFFFYYFALLQSFAHCLTLYLPLILIQVLDLPAWIVNKHTHLHLHLSDIKLKILYGVGVWMLLEV